MIGGDFWVSLPSVVRLSSHIRMRDDPALGFASCRFAGACLRIEAGTTPLSITGPRIRRRLTAAARVPIRSWAYGEPSRAQMCDLRAARGSRIWPTEHAVSASPTLQRIDEADALPVLPNHATRLDRLPV